MAFNVLVTERVDKSCIQAMRTRGCDVDVKLDLSEDELAAAIKPYDALVVRSRTAVSRAVIEAGENLKVIGRAGVSIDNIDVQAATEHGIIVCNAPTSNIVSAAELTMGLILSCARNIGQVNANMHQGTWDSPLNTGSELYEKTLAIIGLGRVGELVANRASSFGMKLIGYDPYCSDERAKALGVTLFESLDALLPVADIITVHLPKTEETKGMFGPREFAAMKDGVILINVARGGIYDEKSLADFVAAGKIGAAAIDVHDREPVEDSPLAEFDNVILTPHIGASTIEAQRRAGVQIASYVVAGLNGSLVPTAVNLVSVPPEVVDTLGPYIPACQMIGSVLAQVSNDIPKTLKIYLLGTIAGVEPASLTASIIKGLLSYKNGITVTPINAQQVAKRHGIEVFSQSGNDALGYTSAVRVIADDVEVSCTCSDSGRLARIVSFLGYNLDIEPSEQSLVFEYVDAAGRIGTIGTILGRHNINITAMKIGTKSQCNRAIVFTNIEGDIDDEIINELRAGVDDLTNLWYLKL